MAETAAGGWVRSAVTSWVSTRPSASLSGTVSAGNALASASTRARASATGISGIALGPRVKIAGLAAAFRQQADALDVHAFFDRLGHVVDGEARDRHGNERFHLDAGLSGHLYRRLHQEAGQSMFRIDLDLDFGDRQRVTERNQAMRALGRHDAGKPRRAQHVALYCIASDDDLERLRAHDDAAFGDGNAF